MALLQLKNVSLAFGAAPILDKVNFALEKGERVCLIGRNGEGKSSLLKLITGQNSPDDGEIIREDGIRFAMLEQDVPSSDDTVLQVVMAGAGKLAHVLAEYHRASERCTSGDMDACTLMGELQHTLDTQDGWELERHAHTVIERIGLVPSDKLSALSGGRKRRVLLARSLVSQPDVLLLDEPTNHLDIDSIAWLENFLLSQNITVLFITHDRAFLDKIATRIIELDRGRLTSYDVSQGVGGYERYQELKEQALQSEQKSFSEFDKKLAQEEVWIRQGIKARRTRNEGRVRALKKLREERQARRNVVGQVAITQNQAEKSGKIVCEAVHLTLQYNDKILVKDFNTTLLRGDKVGIIGDNGVGKTTLIRTLLGLDTSAKTAGDITLGTNLNIAFFDQLKGSLDLEKSVAENVSEGSDFVEVNGKKTHILGYLQDFLFAPSRARTPVKALSGGEKARVLIAKNLLKPANVLVLDEPTNDLDMPTLELLEEFLVQFNGTVLLISHDRAFMDNVVTHIWAFDKDGHGDGVIHSYVGGYSDFVAQHARGVERDAVSTPAKSTAPRPTPATKAKAKLSYKETQELLQLPKDIEALELEQQTLSEQLADGSWFVTDLAAATVASERLSEIEQLLLDKLERWEALDNLS